MMYDVFNVVVVVKIVCCVGPRGAGWREGGYRTVHHTVPRKISRESF